MREIITCRRLEDNNVIWEYVKSGAGIKWCLFLKTASLCSLPHTVLCVCLAHGFSLCFCIRGSTERHWSAGTFGNIVVKAVRAIYFTHPPAVATVGPLEWGQCSEMQSTYPGRKKVVWHSIPCPASLLLPADPTLLWHWELQSGLAECREKLHPLYTNYITTDKAQECEPQSTIVGLERKNKLPLKQKEHFPVLPEMSCELELSLSWLWWWLRFPHKWHQNTSVSSWSLHWPISSCCHLLNRKTFTSGRKVTANRARAKII